MKECSCHTGRICGYHANQIDRTAQRDKQIDAVRQRIVKTDAKNEQKQGARK